MEEGKEERRRSQRGRKGGKERGREDVMRRKRISKGERREGRMIRRKGGRRQKVKGES